MKFKPLSINSLPRVMVKILALSDEERHHFVAQMKQDVDVISELAAFFGARPVKFASPTVENLAEIFAAVLDIPKTERMHFVKPFDRFLNYLGQQDFWGTEGQCDPRGDRRELGDY